jgi:hypothetical protein
MGCGASLGGSAEKYGLISEDPGDGLPFGVSRSSADKGSPYKAACRAYLDYFSSGPSGVTTASGYHLKANVSFALSQTEYPNVGIPPFTFLDAIRSGLQIATYIALDYTSSNVIMHHIPTGGSNPYLDCMEEVASILSEYDTNGIFPLLGYGGKLDGEFPPFYELGVAKGVAGLLDLYKRTRDRIFLCHMSAAEGGDMAWRACRQGHYFCDDFYQIINHVCDVAQQKLQGKPLFELPSEYFLAVLVIDGDTFNDEGTCRAICRASALPISVVLIGVGTSDFPNLSRYDADNKPLSTVEGITAVRDCVQFVRYEEYRRNGVIQRAELAADLLSEVPRQIESYAAIYGVRLPSGVAEKPPKDSKTCDAVFVPRMTYVSGGECKHAQMIELKFRCSGLSTSGGSNSLSVKVVVERLDQTEWIYVGATEVVQEMSSPSFTTPLHIEFIFQRQQHLRFRVCEDTCGSLREYGSAEILLASIVATSGDSLELQLTGGTGSIFITPSSVARRTSVLADHLPEIPCTSLAIVESMNINLCL